MTIMPGRQGLHRQGQVGAECGRADDTAAGRDEHEEERSPDLAEQPAEFERRIVEVGIVLTGLFAIRRSNHARTGSPVAPLDVLAVIPLTSISPIPNRLGPLGLAHDVCSVVDASSPHPGDPSPRIVRQSAVANLAVLRGDDARRRAREIAPATPRRATRMWHDRADGANPVSRTREPAGPARRLACAARRRSARPTLLPDPRGGHRRVRPHRGDPHHALREVVDVRVDLRLVQLGDRDGPRPGRLRVRDVTGRPGDQLVADPVRGRHARDDHRGPRRDGHRFPLEGGPGFGSVRVQGPHHRVRLEHHRPRPHRRAARRRLQAEDRGHRRPRQEPGRRRRLLRPG